MPTKKNRSHASDAPMTLAAAMDLPAKKTNNAGAVNPQDYVFKNITHGNSGGGKRHDPLKSKAGYDVKTHVAIPSAKSMQKRAKVKK